MRGRLRQVIAWIRSGLAPKHKRKSGERTRRKKVKHSSGGHPIEESNVSQINQGVQAVTLLQEPERVGPTLISVHGPHSPIATESPLQAVVIEHSPETQQDRAPGSSFTQSEKHLLNEEYKEESDEDEVDGNPGSRQDLSSGKFVPLCDYLTQDESYCKNPSRRYSCRESDETDWNQGRASGLVYKSEEYKPKCSPLPQDKGCNRSLYQKSEDCFPDGVNHELPEDRLGGYRSVKKEVSQIDVPLKAIPEETSQLLPSPVPDKSLTIYFFSKDYHQWRKIMSTKAYRKCHEQCYLSDNTEKPAYSATRYPKQNSQTMGNYVPRKLSKIMDSEKEQSCSSTQCRSVSLNNNTGDVKCDTSTVDRRTESDKNCREGAESHVVESGNTKNCLHSKDCLASSSFNIAESSSDLAAAANVSHTIDNSELDGSLEENQGKLDELSGNSSFSSATSLNKNATIQYLPPSIWQTRCTQSAVEVALSGTGAAFTFGIGDDHDKVKPNKETLLDDMGDMATAVNGGYTVDTSELEGSFEELQSKNEEVSENSCSIYSSCGSLHPLTKYPSISNEQTICTESAVEAEHSGPDTANKIVTGNDYNGVQTDEETVPGDLGLCVCRLFSSMPSLTEPADKVPEDLGSCRSDRFSSLPSLVELESKVVDDIGPIFSCQFSSLPFLAEPNNKVPDDMSPYRSDLFSSLPSLAELAKRVLDTVGSRFSSSWPSLSEAASNVPDDFSLCLSNLFNSVASLTEPANSVLSRTTSCSSIEDLHVETSSYLSESQPSPFSENYQTERKDSSEFSLPATCNAYLSENQCPDTLDEDALQCSKHTNMMTTSENHRKAILDKMASNAKSLLMPYFATGMFEYPDDDKNETEEVKQDATSMHHERSHEVKRDPRVSETRESEVQVGGSDTEMLDNDKISHLATGDPHILPDTISDDDGDDVDGHRGFDETDALHFGAANSSVSEIELPDCKIRPSEPSVQISNFEVDTFQVQKNSIELEEWHPHQTLYFPSPDKLRTKKWRFLTFGGKVWKFARPDVRELVYTGFYYVGPDDCTQCFSCGIILMEWQENEVPLEEHLKHSPDCSFIRRFSTLQRKFLSPVIDGAIDIVREFNMFEMVTIEKAVERLDLKGVYLFTASQLLDELYLMDDEERVEDIAPSSMYDLPGATCKDLTEELLMKEVSFWPADLASQAIFEELETSKYVDLASQAIFEGLETFKDVEGDNEVLQVGIPAEPQDFPLDITLSELPELPDLRTKGETVHDLKNGSILQSRENDDADGLLKVTDAYGSVSSDAELDAEKLLTESGYCSAESRTSSFGSRNGGYPSSSTEPLLQVTEDQEAQDVDSSSDEYVSASDYEGSSDKDTETEDEVDGPPLLPIEPYDTEERRTELRARLRERNEELRLWSACKVCLTKTVSQLYTNCGHLACCASCSEQLTNCPICRERITTTMTVYLAW